jgi:hypothetical protein
MFPAGQVAVKCWRVYRQRPAAQARAGAGQAMGVPMPAQVPARLQIPAVKRFWALAHAGKQVVPKG